MAASLGEPRPMTLDPSDSPTIPPRWNWKLVLDGDPSLFEPAPRHEARLLLPALPSSLEIQFSSKGAPGRSAIELHLFPETQSAVVRLIGRDTDRLIELWSEASKAGGIPLPRIDERTYGDLTLSLLARSRAGAVRTESGESPGDDGSLRRAPVYYRYEFSGGGLDSALASGPGVDLLFEAVASDPAGCETRAVVSLRQSLL